MYMYFHSKNENAYILAIRSERYTEKYLIKIDGFVILYPVHGWFS